MSYLNLNDVQQKYVDISTKEIEMSEDLIEDSNLIYYNIIHHLLEKKHTAAGIIEFINVLTEYNIYDYYPVNDIIFTEEIIDHLSDDEIDLIFESEDIYEKFGMGGLLKKGISSLKGVVKNLVKKSPKSKKVSIPKPDAPKIDKPKVTYGKGSKPTSDPTLYRDTVKDIRSKRIDRAAKEKAIRSKIEKGSKKPAKASEKSKGGWKRNVAAAGGGAVAGYIAGKGGNNRDMSGGENSGSSGGASSGGTSSGGTSSGGTSSGGTSSGGGAGSSTTSQNSGQSPSSEKLNKKEIDKKSKSDSGLTPMQKWAMNYPKLAARVKPGQSGYDEIQALKKNTPKKENSEKIFDAYELVMDYLISEGHADTFEEADYIMLEMDSDCINNIVDMYSEQYFNPWEYRNKGKKPPAKRKIIDTRTPEQKMTDAVYGRYSGDEKGSLGS